MILDAHPSLRRPGERSPARSPLAVAALAAILVACGGGGGGGGDGGGTSSGGTSSGGTSSGGTSSGGTSSGGTSSGGTTSAPSFKDPAVSPTSAHWGAQGVQFVVSGGANLLNNTFQALLGGKPCTAAAVDPADATKLDVVCDIPSGGTTDTLGLTVMSQGASLTGPMSVALSWTPATGSASFGTSAAVTTTATWWQQKAQLRVTGGVNLPGHVFTASVDGIPCKSVAQSPQDAGELVLTCDTPPGGRTSPAARVVLQENGSTVPGGTLSIDLGECSEPAAPTTGVALPQLCNAQDGSTAATSAGVDGLRGSTFFSDALFMEDEKGQFAATSVSEYFGGTAQLDGGRWMSSDVDEWFASIHRDTTSISGTYAPYGCVKMMGVTSAEFCAYSIANALAVPQSFLQGAWVATGSAVSLTVSGTSFTGTTSGSTFGSCKLSGTIHTASSSKNPFDMTLTAAAGSGTPACELAAGPYSGLAAIEIVNKGSTAAPVYAHELVFMLRIPGQAYLIASALRP